jgi:hypothetical protein
VTMSQMPSSNIPTFFEKSMDMFLSFVCIQFYRLVTRIAILVNDKAYIEELCA